MIHKFFRLLLVMGITGLLALAVWPYHDGALRYGLLLSLVATWAAGWWFLRGRWFWRVGLLALPVLVAIPFCLPEKTYDSVKLRKSYLEALRTMEGTSYLWGGESRRGIDCSGLPRLALREALWQDASRNGNGWAFRELARQWWFDTSAKALGENYRGFTRPLGVSGKLRELDLRNISSGDLAVTADGRHVMVYFGEGKWIQADPMRSKVTICKPVREENAWFDAQVTMHRWTVLGLPMLAWLAGED